MMKQTDPSYQLPIFISVIHVAIRISLANKAPITDCDEVYNYWEPLHFLNFQSGMQTWEYAPQYALRTYAYLLPMSYLSSIYQSLLAVAMEALPPSFLLQLSNLVSPSTSSSLSSLSSSKVLVFHLLRATIAFVTSKAELRLVQSLASYYSIHVAIYTWILLLSSTGMFHTAPAYVPSSTVMVCVFYSLSYQIQSWYYSSREKSHNDNSHNSIVKKAMDSAILFGFIAILMTGWPFCAVLFIPLGLYATMNTFTSNRSSSGVVHVLHLFKRVVCYAVVIQIMVMGVDYNYYGKMSLPTMNIFIYNTGLFSDANDNIDRDELYGVEDISYYIKNLLLNWNVAFVLGVVALPFSIMVRTIAYFMEKKTNAKTGQIQNQKLQLKILILSPMILWIGIVFSRPHKEERFLFPIYPILAIGSALVIDQVLDLMCIPTFIYNVLNGNEVSRSGEGHETKRGISRMKLICGVCLLIPFALCSISRSIVLSDGYTAPLKLYTHLHHHMSMESIDNGNNSASSSDDDKATTLVCVGGEWYRFPSSYHLPGDSQIAFLKSSFGGQLPQQFTKYGSKEESLAIQKGHFNDLNMEETDRYVNVAECSYVIDLLEGTGKDMEEEKPSEYRKLDEREWKEIARYKFLDAENTSLLHRVLYLPFKRQAKYQAYVLFKLNV